MNKCDIGIYGLGIMGQNLAINFANHGFSVAVFNRNTDGDKNVVDGFISKKCFKKNILGTKSEKDFIASIKQPRKIIILVKAGSAVDEVIKNLILFINPNDILIDAGNSHYEDTDKRISLLSSKGFFFAGAGISGGGNGALNGPSIMVGCSNATWRKIRPILQAIAAKRRNGSPCCEHIGSDGAGHFVKMVHNGIEYAIMQILAESYDIMKHMLSISIEKIAQTLAKWNNGKLHSYLISITCDILKMKYSDGTPLVDKILDSAEQKGTGRDISISSLELDVPTTTINEAINARFISRMVSERLCASKIFAKQKFSISAKNKQSLLKMLHDAIYCSQIIAYTQGFLLISKTSEKHNWNISLKKVSEIWENGCIIQSDILNDITNTMGKMTQNKILLFDPYFIEIFKNRQSNWRNVVAASVQHAIPVPVLSSALAFFDGLCSSRLPANLIQAQRDYFGYHGFQRIDSPQNILSHIERYDNYENI